MNYKAHYQRLIERAKGRQLEGYTERHHIVARCQGGTDDPSNVVVLTAREHFVAHQLLVKIYPDHFGLAYAAIMMTRSSARLQRSGNRQYGWLAQRRAELQSVARRGQPSPQRGAKRSERARQNISQGKRGKPSGHLGRKRSAETKARLSAAALKRPKRIASETTRQRHREAWARRKAQGSKARQNELHRKA